jgi:hypothetical protein
MCYNSVACSYLSGGGMSVPKLGSTDSREVDYRAIANEPLFVRMVLVDDRIDFAVAEFTRPRLRPQNVQIWFGIGTTY